MELGEAAFDHGASLEAPPRPSSSPGASARTPIGRVTYRRTNGREFLTHAGHDTEGEPMKSSIGTHGPSGVPTPSPPRPPSGAPPGTSLGPS
jgi:hypothetical protein